MRIAVIGSDVKKHDMRPLFGRIDFIPNVESAIRDIRYLSWLVNEN